MNLNKRIFILEDDPIRIAHFKEVFGSIADLTITNSCVHVDSFKPPYDVIFLDHDLGGRQLSGDVCVYCKGVPEVAAACDYCKGHVGAHEDCGFTFVKSIKDKLRPDDCVIIHSYNSKGAEKMLVEIDPSIPAFYAPYRGTMFNTWIDILRTRWGQDVETKLRA